MRRHQAHGGPGIKVPIPGGISALLKYFSSELFG